MRQTLAVTQAHAYTRIPNAYNTAHTIRPANRNCEYLIWRIVRILLVQFGNDPLKVLYTDFIAFSGIVALV